MDRRRFPDARDTGIALTVSDARPTGTRGLVEDLINAYGGHLAGPAERDGIAVKKRALVWARVSTDAQKERGLSIPQQLREIRAYAQQHYIEIVQEFSEAASAYQNHARRTEFHRMLALALGDQNLDMILVHDYSRFSRDSLRASVLLSELRTSGVEVVSLNDPPLEAGTAAGVFMEAVTFAKNEAFSREKSFHIRKGSRSNLQTRDPDTGWCYKNGGQPPLGYRGLAVQRGTRGSTPAMKRLWELDDTLVAGKPMYEWVRYHLLEVAGKGATLAEICESCAKIGLPAGSPSVAPRMWASRLLPRSLLLYTGQAIWGRSRREGLTWPPVDWGIVGNAHPAIITMDEALGIRAARRPLEGGRVGQSLGCANLLSGGIAKCGSCGKNMVVHQAHLECSNRHQKETSRCSTPYYRAREIEACLLAGIRGVFAALADNPPVLAAVNEELQGAWNRAHRTTAGEPQKAGHSTGALRGDPGATDAAGPCRTEWHQIAIPPVEAPQLNVRAFLSSHRKAEKVLSCASARRRKLWLYQWLQEASLDHDNRLFHVAYRIPEGAILPYGAGRWCVEHSPTLSAILHYGYAITPLDRRGAAGQEP